MHGGTSTFIMVNLKAMSSWGYSGKLDRKLGHCHSVNLVNCLLYRELLVILTLHPLHLGLWHGLRGSQHFIFLHFFWLWCQAVHSPPQEKIWGSPAWEVVGRQQPSAVLFCPTLSNRTNLLLWSWSPRQWLSLVENLGCGHVRLQLDFPVEQCLFLMGQRPLCPTSLLLSSPFNIRQSS